MKVRILYCILLLIPVTVQSQNSELKQLLDSARTIWFVDFDKTEKLLFEAEELIKSHGQGGAADLVEIYQLRINSCNAFSRLQLWRNYLTKSDSLLIAYKSELGADYTRLSLDNDLYRAQYYFQINDETKALELFIRLLTEYKKLPESDKVCHMLYIISNDVAGIYSKRGEYEAAINQYLAGIPYFECVDRERGEQSPRVLIYRNIGVVYLEKKDFQQARRYLNLAEESLQARLKINLFAGARVALSLYETQATYYQRVNQYDSALLVMQKALPLLKLENINNEFKGRISKSIAILYLHENRFKEAQKYFDQAEGYFLNNQGSKAFYLSGLYINNAELFEKQGSVDQALEFCNKAINQLVLNFKPDDNGNPDIRNVISKKQLFSVLQKKSRLEEKLFAERKEFKVLLRAFHTNQLSLALLDSTANEFSLDKDKIILSEQSYAAFEDGIRVSYKLDRETGDEKYFTNIISLIEKSKGNLLLENLRMVNRFSGIKQEWLEREKELKAELLLLEQSLYQEEAKSEKSKDLQKNRERYVSIRRDYSDLIEQIKQEAPDYYRLRFDHSVVSTKKIQQQLLKPKEALIEFFVGDSILAVAGFTKDKKYLKVKEMLPDFTEKMNQFRTMLTTGNSDFFERSSEFYNFLLKDCLAELGSDINSLIIIPDGLLGYLPFEVLIQSKEPKVVYLNDNYSIHYANSATYLMEQMQRKPSEAKNFFAGFVSSGSGQSSGNQVAARDQQYAALQGAEHEVASITELFNSKFTVFNQANKEDFINYASDYKILHFAMHSSLNDLNPMMSVMVFSKTDSTENLLTAIELYSMKLNSDLAVLSACNTGVGQLHRGEGIMSFSRAFAYAGVPSAVISLWKVPDIATSKIMVSFYGHLKNGLSKDKALQLARQDFIRENPEMAHPFYWSGFILTGNAEAITFPSSAWWVWVLLLAIAVLALFYVRRKRLKRLGN